jgi:hypothetical protein
MKITLINEDRSVICAFPVFDKVCLESIRKILELEEFKKFNNVTVLYIPDNDLEFDKIDKDSYSESDIRYSHQTFKLGKYIESIYGIRNSFLITILIREVLTKFL